MVMRIVGMIAFRHVAAVMVVVVMIHLTRGRHVAAVIVRRVDVALGLVRLAAVFRATLPLEATAATAATSTSTAATRTAFRMTITARLAGLGRPVLLQGDLLVQSLLAHAL